MKLDGHHLDSDEEESMIAIDHLGNDRKKDYKKCEKEFSKVFKKATSDFEENEVTPEKDSNFRDYLAERGWKNPTDDMAKVIEWKHVDNMAAGVPEDYSVHHNLIEPTEMNFGDDHFKVQDPRGYACILDNYLKDLRDHGADIVLNFKVSSIFYAPGEVKVEGLDIAEKEEMAYEADSVACTVSIGVLNSNRITFIPPLPEWKTNSFK